MPRTPRTTAPRAPRPPRPAALASTQRAPRRPRAPRAPIVVHTLDGHEIQGPDAGAVIERMRRRGVLTQAKSRQEYMAGVAARYARYDNETISTESPAAFLADLRRVGGLVAGPAPAEPDTDTTDMTTDDEGAQSQDEQQQQQQQREAEQHGA